MKKILIVGQTPPPYHGQAISTQRLMDGNYQHIRLHLVRMHFSGEIDEVGKFRISKILHLLEVIGKIYVYRFRYKADILYYMPVGAQWVPLIRDIIILLATRWLFRKTIFHFRSGHVDRLYHKLPSVIKLLYRRAYYYPDLCIRLSEHNPEDDVALNSMESVIVYNGIEDYFLQYRHLKKNLSEVPQILYVGAIMESKGIFDLLAIAHILSERGRSFRLNIVGKPDSEQTNQKIYDYIRNHDLEEKVVLAGVMLGEAKWQAFKDADIFCFPSHFETFGLVLVEAMQFELPVVATDIGGMRSVVEKEQTGYLSPKGQHHTFADQLEKLLSDDELRRKMGKQGREVFLQKFTVEKYWQHMEQALASV
jgi:glycosyltransferase involved in cell wall biosynthesis